MAEVRQCKECKIFPVPTLNIWARSLRFAAMRFAGTCKRYFQTFTCEERVHKWRCSPSIAVMIFSLFPTNTDRNR
jgi:hypothetical protein